MQTEEFIDRVEKATGVNDRDTAKKVSLATIEAMCMHLPPEQVRQMASQLPRDLSTAASKGTQQGVNPDLEVKLDKFYNEVAIRASMDDDDVREPVRAVVNTFKKAVTDGEFADVVFDLPPDINTLLAS